TSLYMRDLHTCPTRRSSDLNYTLAQRQSQTAARIFTVAVKALEQDKNVIDLVFGNTNAVVFHSKQPVIGDVKGADFNGRGAASPDRKSTRLNSSHVKISYAV